MKHYYTNRLTKEISTSEVRNEKIGEMNIYCGHYETLNEFQKGLEVKTEKIVDGNDKIITKNKWQMPLNRPSWEKYSGDLKYLIWLFISQVELRAQLIFNIEQQSTK